MRAARGVTGVKAIGGVEEIKKKLSPPWILECVMFDERHNALVISPLHCLEHGVTAIDVAQDSFGSRTILHFRLDYNIKRVKKSQPL